MITTYRQVHNTSLPLWVTIFLGWKITWNRLADREYVTDIVVQLSALWKSHPSEEWTWDQFELQWRKSLSIKVGSLARVVHHLPEGDQRAYTLQFSILYMNQANRTKYLHHSSRNPAWSLSHVVCLHWLPHWKLTSSKAPLHPWAWPEAPWQCIRTDYAGHFMGKMMLIVTDAHSK